MYMHLADYCRLLSTAIPKVTVAEISTVLQFAEDNTHGAAVVTLCYKICEWINTVH